MPSGRLDPPLPPTEREYEATLEQDRYYHFTDSQFSGGNLITAFLSYIDVTLFGRRTAGCSHTYRIKALQKLAFKPSNEYVLQTLQQPGVNEYLHTHMSKRSLYMIVGLAIARGAEVSQTDHHGRAWGAGAKLSGTPVGIPVGGAVLGESGNSYHTDTTFKIPGEFVFAYRLRRCRYFKSQLKTNFYSHGATLCDLQGVPSEEIPPLIDRSSESDVILEAKVAAIDLNERELDIDDITSSKVDGSDEESEYQYIHLKDFV